MELRHPFDYGSLISDLKDDCDTEGFSVHVPPQQLPTITADSGETHDRKIVFINYIDWAAFGAALLESSSNETTVIALNPEDRKPKQTWS